MTLASGKLKFKQSHKILVTRSREDTRKFVSSIESTDDLRITISIPIYHQTTMDLRPGERIVVSVPMDNHVIEFESSVISLKEENIILLDIEHPQGYTRIQRRQAFRLKVLLDLEVAVPPGKDQEPLFKKAVGLDISAGGMEIMTDRRYEPESHLLVRFDLDVTKKITHGFCLDTVVKRCFQIGKRTYKVGVQFRNLSRQESDKIFQYIFKKSSDANIWKK